MPAASSLNSNQKKGVEISSGPLLIVAGAGTGKTFTLVEKIKYLIQNNFAKPEEILCLTFTEKAAREMEERVDLALPYGYFQMWIATFHSFADQILREKISHIGINPGYTLLTQAEAVIFLRKHLFLFNLHYFRPLGNPHKFLEALLQHFSRLKDEDISPEQYTQWALEQSTNETMLAEDKEKYTELANAYKTYQDLKVKEGYFDFSDLMYYLLEVYRKRPNLLAEDRKKFKYILVDEFQDTNIAQYQLIKLLCPPESKPNLTVVGDDSQAIYKFRGASISNILTFMKDYPDAQQVTLNDNYRSNQTILDLSHQLIQNNNPDTLESQLGISKKLIAHKKNVKEAVDFHYAQKGDDEADWVAKTIIELKQKNNYSFSDFAILVRANSHADAFLTALHRQGIPYQFMGPGMLFKQPEIKDLIAYLKILYNLEDSPSLFRILTMSIFNLDDQDIALLLAFSRKISIPFYQSIEIYLSFFHDEWYRSEHLLYKQYIPQIKEETRTKLIEIVGMIKKHLKLIKTDTAGQILYYFFEDTGYLKLMTSYQNEKEEKIALNVTKFFNKLKSFEGEHEDSSVFAVVDYIDMSMELGESPITAEKDVALGNAVNILTLHGAKGLEFPVVFLVNLIKGRFPTYEKKETIPIPQDLIKEILPQGDYHVQEERRLFYVGLTRGKDRVFLTAAQGYGEAKRERKISPFVIETLGEEKIKNTQLLKQEEKTQLSIFDFKKIETPVVKEPLDIKNFSFSQLESYNICPLQYKYQYVLKIPTPPAAAASYGDTIHKTLQKFYAKFIQDSTIGLEEMLQMFDEVWVPLGYASAAHQERMKKEGKKMLKHYFETFHNPHLTVVGLEKIFKIKVDDNIFITGKIDRVDQKADGEIEIIDYKTGKKPADKELQKSLQLSIYAMAANNQGLYNRPLDKVNLTFYYLQTMEKTSMKRTAEEMIDVKDKIKETVDKIKENKFEPKVGPWCNFCAFKIICEAW